MTLSARLLPLFALLPGWVWAAEAERPVVPGPGVGSAMQMLVSLLVVVAFIAAMAWLMRRFARLPFGSGGVIKVLGGVSLGHRERAVLVQVGETQLLVGVAPGRVQTLHVLDEPVVVEGGPRNSAFAERLAGALRRRENLS